MSEIHSYIDELSRKPDEELRRNGVHPEEWRQVLHREREDASTLFEAIARKNGELKNDRELTGDEIRLQLIRWFSASYHHRKQTRKSGGFYSEHLWAAAEAAVRFGFTELEMVSALMGHDAPEDIEELREGRTPLFFTGLGAYNGSVKAENDKIRSYIDVVTKPEIDDREERSKVYLQALIESLIQDPRPVLVKLFDRWHNMKTLEAQKPEKQLKIAKETLDVFVPLARVLGLYQLQEELLRLCLKYLNPDLLSGVDAFVSERVQKVENSSIWERIQAEMSNVQGVRSIALEPHKAVSRWDVLPPNVTVDKATFRDFGLGKEDPFVWVAFRVEEERDILPTAQALQSKLPGDRWQFNESYGFGRGTSAKTIGNHYGVFGGRVFFRVTTSEQDARSTRGWFYKGGFAMPDSIPEGARRSISRAKGGEDIRHVVQEELLFPTIRISTFIEGNLNYVDVAHSCTARQLYAKIYGIEPDPTQAVVVQKDPFANPLRATALPFDMDAPLPNGYTVLFN